MGLLRKLAEIRERQILEHAEPFLDEGEKVLAWIRTKRPDKGSRGFMFVTDKRIVVSWPKIGPDSDRALEWEDIQAWGIAPDGEKGPTFAVETEDELCQAHILVGTEGMVAKANEFLVHFVDQAAVPKRELRLVEDPSRYRTAELSVERERKSVGKHTRRAIVTIVGLGLMAFAVVIGWIPGPWSLPVFIAGLAVLATEYDWADDFLTWSRHRYARAKAKFKARRSPAGE